MVILLFVLTSPLLYADQGVIGQIKIVKGQTVVIHNGMVDSAKIGTKIYRQDILRTGADGSLAFILKDNTVMSIGPDSEIILRKFQFEPRYKEFSLIMKIIKGTVSFISGKISKLAPESVKIETPDSIIGIRGTRFLIKVEQD
jgi:hypothetical protein